MKKTCAASIATISALIVPLSLAPAAHAESTPSESSAVVSPSASPISDNTLTIQPNQLSAEDQAFVNHVSSASKAFVERDGKIALSISDDVLKSKYGFSNNEVQRLHRDVLGKSIQKTLEENNYYAPRASVQGAAVCFSPQDLAVGAGAALVAAADAGPVAIAAALEALATAFGGPVGIVIGAILAVASAPSLIEIGGRAVTAVATNRGLKIGTRWDYPPVYADYC